MIVGVVTITGCGHASQVINATPPTVVCRHVLNDTPAGAVHYDVAQVLGPIAAVSVRGLILLKVSVACRSGVTVTWNPASAARLEDRAQTDDAQLAAVVLQPIDARAAFATQAPGSRLPRYDQDEHRRSTCTARCSACGMGGFSAGDGLLEAGSVTAGRVREHCAQSGEGGGEGVIGRDRVADDERRLVRPSSGEAVGVEAFDGESVLRGAGDGLVLAVGVR